MTSLVEFLRARIYDDEQWAQRTESGQRWEAIDDGEYGPQVRVGSGDVDDRGPEWRREVNVQVWHCDDEQDGCPGSARAWAAEAEHIARHDPARVLADVAAKRQIVDHAEHWQETLYATPEGWTAVAATAYRMAMQWTLELLALPYADHPDYDPSWRP